MTTLSIRVVRRPRKRFTCDHCERGIDGLHLRLYGRAEGMFTPMQTLRLCARCCGHYRDMAPKDPTFAAALAALEER